MSKRVAKLIMVTSANNNKFYDMVENDDGSISIDFGRVGVTSTKLNYPSGKKKWESLYNEKVKKGYVDQTSLRVVLQPTTQFAEVKDASARGLIAALRKYANKSVQENYTISSEAVTQAQIDTAQAILDKLVQLVYPRSATKEINDALLNLYGVIPRRMAHVKKHLIAEDRVTVANIDDINKLVANEQATLDVMRGQVVTNQAQQTNVQPTSSILDALGLEVRPFNEQDKVAVRQLLGENARRFRSGFRVKHEVSHQRMLSWVEKAKYKNVHSLWHGSRNENWWNILQTGLLIRPANAVITGAMFGYGIYGANKAQKSIGYTSLQGSYWAGGASQTAFLGLFSFHLGNMYQTQRHESWMSTLDYSKLTKMGAYDSCYAQAGHSLRNDEFIVYNIAQVDIWGIVEIG
jgi:poly [ADP-ribose] polymerase